MIIVDTGFWLALANKKDTHHALAVEVFEGKGGKGARLEWH
jgi:predicted nucleic acid-binding protein